MRRAKIVATLGPATSTYESVRAIIDAGVDVAMVYYFFGNKEGLFSASVLDVPEHPLHQLAGLLEESPDPSEEEIRHALEGNLCRCTGYQNIVKAVRAAATA